MDLSTISTCSGSREYIRKTCPSEVNILEDIETMVLSWTFKSDEDLLVIEEDMNLIVDELQKKYLRSNDSILSYALHSITYNILSQYLMPLVRNKFKKEDLRIHERCRYLSKSKRLVDPALKYLDSLSFTAAIVELSMLDNQKSPLEKISCLCSTYDLIFVELKASLIALISKYSEKEVDIPVIDNEDVIPAVVLVVIKSKLMYLRSNLYFIKHFGDKMLKENEHMRLVIENFENALHNLMDLKENESETLQDLNISTAINLITNIHKPENIPAGTAGDEHRQRLVELIMMATSERDFIPINLPKSL